MGDNKPKKKRFAKFLFVVLAVFVANLLCLGVGFALLAWSDNASGHPAGGLFASLEGCNATGLDIRGMIDTYGDTIGANAPAVPSDTTQDMTSSENIVSHIEDAANDPNIKALFIEIDSGGGMPQAALEIEKALQESGKPSVAWIRGYGDSAAYWIATGASTIVASPESDIGSIGVTLSFLDNAKQNAQAGITFNSLSTGKFKDTGSPDKPLTSDERAYLEKSLDITLQHFIQAVSDNRKIPIEKVRALADGSSMLGEEALENKLIDVLGTKKEAMDALEKLVGEKPKICWPQY
jgi:protease-4